MGCHTLANHTLQSGQTDAVLVLKQLAHAADAAVSEMVDIIIGSDAVFHVHVVVDGGENILFGDMLGHKLMHASAENIAERLCILILLEMHQDLAEGGIIDLLSDAEILGIAVHIMGQINHEVGQDLDRTLLRLDPDIGNRGILDQIRHLAVNFLAGASQNISCSLVDNILCEDLADDPAAHGKFLVELVSADLGQIVAAGIKKHRIDQAVRTLDRERLAGTDLLVQFKKTGLKVVGRILCKAGAELGLIAEQIHDLLIGSDSKCTNKDSDRYLPGSVHTNIEHVVGVRLVLKPCAPVGDHGAGEQALAELVLVNSIINAGGTDQLADDYTLSTVDYEGSVLCHQGQVTHEDLLLLDLSVIFLVIQADSDSERSCIGAVSLFALFDRIFRVLFFKGITCKSQAEMPAEILDRRNVIQYFLKALVTKPLIGVLLNLDQIRHRQNFLLALIAHTDVFTTACRMYPVFFHLIHPVNHALSLAPARDSCAAGFHPVRMSRSHAAFIQTALCISSHSVQDHTLFRLCTMIDQGL